MPAAIAGGTITVLAAQAATGWGGGVWSWIWGTLIAVLCGGLTLYFCFFHPKTGEVLIDTESELRKVVWPSREEVTGSTIVVIVATFLLGVSIFLMDFILAKGMALTGLY